MPLKRLNSSPAVSQVHPKNAVAFTAKTLWPLVILRIQQSSCNYSSVWACLRTASRKSTTVERLNRECISTGGGSISSGQSLAGLKLTPADQLANRRLQLFRPPRGVAPCYDRTLHRLRNLEVMPDPEAMHTSMPCSPPAR
jgi:hypothetical protein